MIDRETVDRILAAADIVEVVGDFVQLKRKGTNYTACCPFHNEKTPSFIVSPAKGLYKCFGCGEGGGAAKFVMSHEKLSYPDALKWLARKYGIHVQERELSPQEQAANNDRESMMVLNTWAEGYFQSQLDMPEGQNIARSYLEERGISEESIRKFALGYNPERGAQMTHAALKEGYQERFLLATGLTGQSERDKSLYDRYSARIIFPIHSLSGRVIGFGGRTMRTDKKLAKYVNSPESEIYHKSNTLYGIHLAKKSIMQRDKAILVEGYTDVISMHQSGIENVVASSGTSLTVGQIKLLKRFSPNVTLIYDGDSAGIKASMRGVDLLLGEGMSVRVVPLPEGEDPDSFARAHSTDQINDYIAEKEEDFLAFKIHTLMQGEESSDPIKRAQIISDIIGSIVVIPDNVQRSVYIAECARLMDIERGVLENEVRIKRAGAVDGNAGRQVARNAIRSERFRANQSTSRVTPRPASADAPPPEDLFNDDYPSLSGAPVGITPHKPSRSQLELKNLEKEIVTSLVSFGERKFDFSLPNGDIMELEVAQTLIDELRGDSIEIKHEPYRTIFAEYCQRFDDGERPHVREFLNHPNGAISQFVVDIESQNELYKPSKIWQRNDILVRTAGDMLSDSIPKILVIYKSKVIGDRIASLQSELLGLESMEQAQKIVEEISRLNEIRSQLLEKYQRLH